MVQVLRWPPHDRTPGHGLDRRLRRHPPALDFQPALHVFYEETVLRVQDGLPKMKDVPAEMGGSGETLPE